MAAAGGRQVTREGPRQRKPREPTQPGPARADLASFREATYRLLSQAFLYPEEERLKAVAGAAHALRESGDALAQFAFFLQWRQLLQHLARLGERKAEEIQWRYVSMFSANPAGVPCPPYESVYREPAGRPSGWLLAQLEHTYGVAGLALAPALGELPDHVAVELEFVALLCGQEAEAWESESVGPAIKALRRQKRFLDRHLTVWFPEFVRQLAAADVGGLYTAVGNGAMTFMSYDIDLLAALLEEAPDLTGASQATDRR